MKEVIGGQGLQFRQMRCDPERRYVGTFCIITTNALPRIACTDKAINGTDEDWNAIEDRMVKIERTEYHEWDKEVDWPLTAKMLAHYLKQKLDQDTFQEEIEETAEEFERLFDV